MARRHSVAVDLDGVLATYHGWKGPRELGPPLDGALVFCNELASKYDVIIYTSRITPTSGGREDLSEEEKQAHVTEIKELVAAWLDTHGFRYHSIYTGTGKPIASAYVDDRAVQCRPMDPVGVTANEEYSNALIEVDYLCKYTSQKEKDI